MKTYENVWYNRISNRWFTIESMLRRFQWWTTDHKIFMVVTATPCAKEKKTNSNHDDYLFIYLFIIRNNYVVNYFTIKKRSKKKLFGREKTRKKKTKIECVNLIIKWIKLRYMRSHLVCPYMNTVVSADEKFVFSSHYSHWRLLWTSFIVTIEIQ